MDQEVNYENIPKEQNLKENEGYEGFGGSDSRYMPGREDEEKGKKPLPEGIGNYEVEPSSILEEKAPFGGKVSSSSVLTLDGSAMHKMDNRAMPQNVGYQE